MLDYDIVYDLYIKQKINPYELAKKLNCCPRTIYNFLKKHNLQENRNLTDLTNKKVGSLLVLERTEKQTKNRTCIWKCKCDCGKIKYVDTGSLTVGKPKSCGYKCSQYPTGSKHGSWKGFAEITGHKWSNIKGGAKLRNIDFEIDIKEVWEKFERQDRTCYLTGLPISFTNMTSSLDRIDSSKPYRIDNVAWCHTDINKIKIDFSVEELCYWASLITCPLKLTDNNQISKMSKSLWGDILYNSKRRNISINISKSDVVDLFNKQNGKCYLSGINLNISSYKYKTGSLDRLTNKIGYQLGNLGWCHKLLNVSRKQFDLKYYKKMMKLVNKRGFDAICTASCA